MPKLALEDEFFDRKDRIYDIQVEIREEIENMDIIKEKIVMEKEKIKINEERIEKLAEQVLQTGEKSDENLEGQEPKISKEGESKSKNLPNDPDWWKSYGKNQI